MTQDGLYAKTKSWGLKMTKHKWHDEIVAWEGGARVERQYITCEDDEPWELVQDGFTPNWDSPDWRFRLHDPYREVAEAMKRGELCQYRFGNEWFDATGKLSDYSECWDDLEWRIAPKPKEKEFVFTHMNQGGTFITNFSTERKAVFVEAIRRFADPKVVLCEKSSPAWPNGGGSLHVMDGRRDLSDFWRVFYQAEKDLAGKPDPYREFREAQDRGEVVEYLGHSGNWVYQGPCLFTDPPDRYRIAKPEPKEEELYVLVTPQRVITSYMAVSLDHIKHTKSQIERETRIAKLQFID